ncbi:MAG: CNP1-like family protein [Betaproteobacteria bacterium]|nr:CNP1-like family protein [Betaproteobacteria bacterium]
MNEKKIVNLKVGAALLFSCFCLNTLAQEVPMSGTRHRGSAAEEDAAPKKEWEVVLPAFPKDEDLLPFYVSPIQTQKFAIDKKTLATDEKEIRYTLVGLSSSGAKNITYEGIKCDGGLYRRYAMGRYDGTWSPSQHNEWKDIHFQDANRPQAALVLHYFCQGRAVAGKPEEMLFRIQYNRSLQGDKYDGR